MLFYSLLGSGPVEPKMSIFNRQILSHQPAVKERTVITYTKPTSGVWGFLPAIGRIFKKLIYKSKFAQIRKHVTNINRNRP